MLKRLYADNFRALVNFEFRPGRLNLLLGDNGSGKTSVFQVLRNLRDLVIQGRPAAEVFGDSRTRWESRDVQRFELDFERDDRSYRYVLEIQHPDSPLRKATLQSEEVVCNGHRLFAFEEGLVTLTEEAGVASAGFPYSAERSFLASVDVASTRPLRSVVQFKKSLIDMLTLQPNPFPTEWLSRREEPFFSWDGSNFASVFRFLTGERPAVRADLEVRLREAIPGFRDFVLRGVGDQKQLRVSFELENREEDLSFGDLSEGQRVLAMLYTAVPAHLSRGALVCFDEPDNFVSLPEIQPWLQLLRDTVEERGGQAMIISHHPEVMDYLVQDSVWHFDRPSGPVRVRPYEPEAGPDTEGLKLSELVVQGL